MLFFLQYCIVLHLATQYFSTYWKAAFRVTPFLLVFGPTVSSGFVWHEHPLPIWSYTECWKSKRSGRSGICFAIDRSPYRFDWIAIWIRSDWRLASEETFSSGYIDKLSRRYCKRGTPSYRRFSPRSLRKNWFRPRMCYRTWNSWWYPQNRRCFGMLFDSGFFISGLTVSEHQIGG